MSVSPNLRSALANKIGTFHLHARLHQGQLSILKAVCAVGWGIFRFSRRCLEPISKSPMGKLKLLVLLELQSLLLQFGDFLLRLQERRFLLAQRFFERKNFLLQGEQLPVVVEQAVLRIQQLFSQSRKCRRHLIEVANSSRGSYKVPCSTDGAVGSSDER